MSKIISNAVAKVNLTLRIIRDEIGAAGYHRIESLFVFLGGIYDTLELDDTAPFNESSGAIAGVKNSDNSVRTAFKILVDNFDRPAPDVRITKRLPICGGIGGGSSDAACFINSVFDYWSMSLQEKLSCVNMFDALGSDAKIFLYKYFWKCDSLYALGTGLDNPPVVINLPINGYVVLVNAGDTLSTKTAYEKFAGPYCDEIGVNEIMNQLRRNGVAYNSLAAAAIQLAPSIRSVLSNVRETQPTLYGLSGSGPTCFGVYDSLPAAQVAATLLRRSATFVAISPLATYAGITNPMPSTSSSSAL
ncbi:MAG: hypothetical protein LBJ42_00860 [Holosporales bacterium]|jgi:4-diphosphocytidyl-2-C-methyl-D-erythritol kinase|nr:hypothetical protein [Holosporales bacterium]